MGLFHENTSQLIAILLNNWPNTDNLVAFQKIVLKIISKKDKFYCVCYLFLQDSTCFHLTTHIPWNNVFKFDLLLNKYRNELYALKTQDLTNIGKPITNLMLPLTNK